MATRGRPSALKDPAFVRIVAELFANGHSRKAMIEELGKLGFQVKDVDTITRWRRDPRVKTIVTKLIEDRAQEISRKVDAVLAGRLTDPESIPTDTLLKIRREYGGATVQRREVADDNVTADAIKTMESDPEFLTKFESLLKGETEEADEEVLVEA